MFHLVSKRCYEHELPGNSIYSCHGKFYSQTWLKLLLFTFFCICTTVTWDCADIGGPLDVIIVKTTANMYQFICTPFHGIFKTFNSLCGVFISISISIFRSGTYHIMDVPVKCMHSAILRWHSVWIIGSAVDSVICAKLLSYLRISLNKLCCFNIKIFYKIKSLSHQTLIHVLPKNSTCDGFKSLHSKIPRIRAHSV